MTRLHSAIRAVIEAISSASTIPAESIGHDEDIVDDLSLDALELISLALILEEVFSIAVPDDLFEAPRHRTPEGLAEWCIAKSDRSDWEELQRQRRA